jgi:hypothetical protein
MPLDFYQVSLKYRMIIKGVTVKAQQKCCLEKIILQVERLHMTSQPPCWCSNSKEFDSLVWNTNIAV